jgi:hypothetical protein
MTNDEKRELFQDLLAKRSRVYADAPGGPVQVHSMPWNSDQASITPVNRFSGESLGNQRKISISDLDNFRMLPKEPRNLKEQLRELERRYRAIDS